MERPCPAEVIDPKVSAERQSRVARTGQARNGRSRPRAFCRFGGMSASETPDPIPNSAVKRRRADGTASQDVGE